LVQASAGSGKTFALTNRYLRLVAAGVSGDSILATTFTRKAAGEILDRIMQRLTAAASAPASCRRLANELEIEWDVPQVRQALRHLCENLHRLQISTLDSFFGRLARVFSFELGLPSGKSSRGGGLKS
jgi:ATP-dependent exoDNAse (exonuclease V) beta subunit